MAPLTKYFVNMTKDERDDIASDQFSRIITHLRATTRPGMTGLNLMYLFAAYLQNQNEFTNEELEIITDIVKGNSQEG